MNKTSIDNALKNAKDKQATKKALLAQLYTEKHATPRELYFCLIEYIVSHE